MVPFHRLPVPPQQTVTSANTRRRTILVAGRRARANFVARFLDVVGVEVRKPEDVAKALVCTRGRDCNGFFGRLPCAPSLPILSLEPAPGVSRE